MIIAIIRQALSPAILIPVLRDALSRHQRRRPCRNQPVVFVDDGKIPEPTILGHALGFTDHPRHSTLTLLSLIRADISRGGASS